MNKTKITLLVIAGVALAGTLALGFLIYNAWSGKGESDEEIGYLRDDASRLMGLKVFPSQESVKATEANRKAYAEWCEVATALASAGDLKFDPTTPASFKSAITERAKRFSELPGDISGRFVKADFGFGFDDYILRGALPAAADLPRLQREWHDVSEFLNLLADAKATSVFELAMVREEAKEEQPAKGRRKRQKRSEEDAAKPDVTRFAITFSASAPAFVAVLNAIASSPRFIVAEDMAFARSTDEVAVKLGGNAAKKTETTGRRRGRRQAAVEKPAEEADSATGVIVDPAAIPDFKVTMRVAVYDFRTKSAPQNVQEETK